MTTQVKIILVQPISSQQPSSLWMQIPKHVADMGQPCLSPIHKLHNNLHVQTYCNNDQLKRGF